MNWTIKIDSRMAKSLMKLDPEQRRRIVKFIDQLADGNNPRSSGKALQGKLKGLWRYPCRRLPLDLSDQG